jgi:hypothetical protein
LCDHLWRPEKPDNLPVAVAVVFEEVKEKFLFFMETVQVVDGFGSVCCGGRHSLLVLLVVVRRSI